MRGGFGGLAVGRTILSQLSVNMKRQVHREAGALSFDAFDRDTTVV